MGRYSRKDMIEFANFAKSYQSSKKVKEAYNAYLKGARQKTRKIMSDERQDSIEELRAKMLPKIKELKRLLIYSQEYEDVSIMRDMEKKYLDKETEK